MEHSDPTYFKSIDEMSEEELKKFRGELDYEIAIKRTNEQGKTGQGELARQVKKKLDELATLTRADKQNPDDNRHDGRSK